MDAEPGRAADLFPAFRSVDAQDYFDLTFGYTFRDLGRVTILVNNVFDKEPPILGNTTGSPAFNSGNTFPSLFDTLGRTYSVNLKVTF
jgi:outer membrane receptor protein involved in Fe transport